MDDVSDTSQLSSSILQQESTSVRMANSILTQLHVAKKIKQFSEISGSLFVTMYEGLCGELLPDVIRNPHSVEDDVHNAQTVIDALSLEVLHTSLSHISGDAIARGDRTAIANLLDLFSSLMEFILNRIECDLSTDDEGVEHDRETSDFIDNVLSRELGDGLELDDNENHVYLDDNYEDDDTCDDEPRERNENSTLEMIRESEEIERRLRAEDEARRQRAMEEFRREDEVRRRLRDEEEKMLVDDAMKRYGEKVMDEGSSESLEALHLSDTATSDPSLSASQHHFSGVGENLTHDLTSSKHQYSSLLSLTEETSALARSAVRNSPARARAERSAFLEAAIKSALKKINREAKDVEELVGDLPKKSVRLKLSDEFFTEVPRKSPARARKPYHPRPGSINNNANSSDDDLPRPHIEKMSRHVSPPTIPTPFVADKDRATISALPQFPKRVSTKEKTNQLRRLYAFDYKNLAKDHQKLSEKSRSRADAVQRSMRKSLAKSPRQCRSSVDGKKKLRVQRKSASASPPRRRRSVNFDDDNDLFNVLDAFPSIYLSTDTLHDLWRQSAKQIGQLNRIELDTKRKDAQHAQLEQAARRQQMVSEIFRKDVEHRRRMNEIKERKERKRSVRLGLQEKRAQSARIRRYYEEFQTGLRSKMLNKRIRDELIFKRVFKDGLAIQRQCIRDMRKYAKEHRAKKSRVQQDEIESLENFYRDQFLLLADATKRERADVNERQKAQTSVIDRMKRELRAKMETEIRNIQSQLCEEDDGHFRQLDADRLHQDLMLAKYKAYV